MNVDFVISPDATSLSVAESLMLDMIEQERAKREAEEKKDVIIPKLENVIEVYNKLDTSEEKNVLLKSILEKVTYLKTEKAIKQNSDPTNFEIHIYPKIPKVH